MWVRYSGSKSVADFQPAILLGESFFLGRCPKLGCLRLSACKGLVNNTYKL